MAGLDPAIHAFGFRNAGRKTWMPGTRPGMTERVRQNRFRPDTDGKVLVKTPGFIEAHCLWTDEQRRQAAEIKRRIDKDNLHLVRLAWPTHTAHRAPRR